MSGEEPGREPPGLDDAARARRLRRVLRWSQAGGLVFLAVVSLGMLPRILASLFPGLGDAAAGPVMLLAIVAPIVLLVVAALRLPR